MWVKHVSQEIPNHPNASIKRPSTFSPLTHSKPLYGNHFPATGKPPIKMLEESISTIWASIYGWFTPTMLFVLVNLVIWTIAVNSIMGQKEPKKLTRSPSVIERLRSFNIYRQRSQDITPSIAAIVDPLQEDEKPSAVADGGEIGTQDQAHVETDEHQFSRSRSDTKPDAGSARPEKLPKKLKKSASTKSAFSHFEAEDPPRQRPSSVRGSKTHLLGDDGLDESGEVDAKADDFINRFKQNLKLQRLESFARYKEMLNRGK